MPDRVSDAAEVRSGMRLDGLDTRTAKDGVAAVPTEDLVREVVEIRVDAEAAAREHSMQRHVIRTVRLARE